MFKKIKVFFKSKNKCSDCQKNHPNKCPRCTIVDDYDNDVRNA